MTATTRRDGPSPRDSALSGLEVWLTGTQTELRAALSALATTTAVAQQGAPRALSGADAGRWRIYLRLSVATTHPTGHRPAPTADGRATLIDLATVRATRRPA